MQRRGRPGGLPAATRHQGQSEDECRDEKKFARSFQSKLPLVGVRTTLVRMAGADGNHATISHFTGVQLELDGGVMNVELLVQFGANLLEDDRALRRRYVLYAYVA